MALILPQNVSKDSLRKMINGRMFYEIVDPSQVSTQQALGWRLANIDMTRSLTKRGKFEFKRVTL